MDYLDDVYTRFASGDPALATALADGDPLTLAQVRRILRHTPLHVLARSRASLVRALAAVPDLHQPLRATWSRMDASLTAQVFAWVEQSRIHADRRTHSGSLTLTASSAA